eukprot:COSAG02_NODE_3390_length_6822_cov_7.140860_8_plen_103_part_00
MHVHYNLISGSKREEPACTYASMSTQTIPFQMPAYTYSHHLCVGIAVCNTVASSSLQLMQSTEFWMYTFWPLSRAAPRTENYMQTAIADNSCHMHSLVKHVR